VPSAFRLTGLESAPTSSRAPTNNSSTFFTVEHLSGWFWWFDRANVGAQSGLAAPGLKRSAVLKSKKIMTLKSALEDFSETTLAAIAGSLGRFAYVARLRESVAEPYAHWGLRRVYGEQAAQQAIAEAHRKLFLQLLRTPLRSLMTDLQISAEYSEGSLTEYVERLRSRCGALLQPNLAAARHATSIQCCTLSLFWLRLRRRFHRTPIAEFKRNANNLADDLCILRMAQHTDRDGGKRMRLQQNVVAL